MHIQKIYRVESMGDFIFPWHLTCNGKHIQYFKNKDVADRVCDKLNAEEMIENRCNKFELK